LLTDGAGAWLALLRVEFVAVLALLDTLSLARALRSAASASICFSLVA